MTHLEVAERRPELPDVQFERIIWLSGEHLGWHRASIVVRNATTQWRPDAKPFFEGRVHREHNCELEVGQVHARPRDGDEVVFRALREPLNQEVVFKHVLKRAREKSLVNFGHVWSIKTRPFTR